MSQFALSALFEYIGYGSTAMLPLYINSFSAGTVFIRQNLVSTDVRF